MTKARQATRKKARKCARGVSTLLAIYDKRALASVRKDLCACVVEEMTALQAATINEAHPGFKPALLLEVHEIAWTLVVANQTRSTQQNPSGLLDVAASVRAMGSLEVPPTLAEIERNPYIKAARLRQYKVEKVVRDRMKAQLSQFGTFLWRAKATGALSNLREPAYDRDKAGAFLERVQHLSAHELKELAVKLPAFGGRFLYAYAAYDEGLDRPNGHGFAGWPKERSLYSARTLMRTDKGAPGRDDPRTKSHDTLLACPATWGDTHQVQSIIRDFFSI